MTLPPLAPAITPYFTSCLARVREAQVPQCAHAAENVEQLAHELLRYAVLERRIEDDERLDERRV